MHNEEWVSRFVISNCYFLFCEGDNPMFRVRLKFKNYRTKKELLIPQSGFARIIIRQVRLKRYFCRFSEYFLPGD